IRASEDRSAHDESHATNAAVRQLTELRVGHVGSQQGDPSRIRRKAFDCIERNVVIARVREGRDDDVASGADATLQESIFLHPSIRLKARNFAHWLKPTRIVN